MRIKLCFIRHLNTHSLEITYTLNTTTFKSTLYGTYLVLFIIALYIGGEAASPNSNAVLDAVVPLQTSGNRGARLPPAAEPSPHAPAPPLPVARRLARCERPPPGAAGVDQEQFIRRSQ
jgi:hypothetical protein